MAAYDTFVNAVLVAHKPPQTWDSCAQALSSAINAYMLAGVGHTEVTGIVVPPNGSSYSATGSGLESNRVTAGYPTMTQAIVEAYHNPVWLGLGAKIASSVISYIASITVTTVVTGTLIGTGVQGKLISAQGSTLTSNLDSLFVGSHTWESVSRGIATAIKAYFDSLILQTIDSGTTPPASWAGTGIGNITWS